MLQLAAAYSYCGSKSGGHSADLICLNYMDVLPTWQLVVAHGDIAGVFWVESLSIVQQSVCSQ